MSAPAASLSAALLVTKGNAQPSRGLAQPMTERIGFGMRDTDTRAIEAVPIMQTLPPGFAPPPAAGTAPSRITLRVDGTQRLRLRLASAHLGKSRQAILIEALEHYFKRVLPAFLHDPCPCIQAGDFQAGGIQGGSAIGGDCCQRSES